jgi:L-iditol 2-dehydrogenase
VKALRLHGVGDLRLDEEAPPEPGPGELLLRIRAVGLCGSDRHWFAEGAIGDAALTRPLVLGHEFTATVEAGPRAGERVAVDPAHPCGVCEPCGRGLPHLCLDVRFAGHGTTDGALRDLMAWPEELAFPISERISDDDAPLLEPLGVALHALDLAKARPGTTAGVFGCGPLGLLIVQALHAVGASVAIATDVLPHRIEAAQGLGVGLAAPAGTGSPPVDVAFEVAGEDAALDDAIAATRPGGRVVLVGIPSSDRTSFTASVARRKGLTLLVCRRMRPEHLPRAIRLAESGGVDLASLLTARYRLEEWPQAFSDLRDRSGHKVIVMPRDSE